MRNGGDDRKGRTNGFILKSHCEQTILQTNCIELKRTLQGRREADRQDVLIRGLCTCIMYRQDEKEIQAIIRSNWYYIMLYIHKGRGEAEEGEEEDRVM